MSSKSIEERLSRLEEKVGTKLTTRVLVIQDKSGSMGGHAKETIEGYNEYISSLADDDSDQLFLTLVQFDHEYVVVEEGTPIDKVEPLNDKRYKVRGATALLDAVGRGINDLRSEMNKGDRAFVVIMTDGYENSSTEYTKQKVHKLIDKCENEGNWTFTFLGAGRDSWSGGDLIGLRRNQAVYFGEGASEKEMAFRSLANTTGQYRGASAMSATATGAMTTDFMAKEGAEVEVEGDDEDDE